MTVAGVSVGVAFAATGGAPAGGTTGGDGHSGSPAADASSAAAMSGHGTRYRSTPSQGRASSSARSGTADGQRRAGSAHAAGSSKRAGSTPKAAPSGKPAPSASAKPSPSASAAPAKPYEFYDSIDPETVPAGAEVAAYATGAHPTPTSLVAGRKKVLWIDTEGTDPKAQVIDVEPGCASPSQVPQWVQGHLTDDPGSVAIVYTTISQWSEVQQDVSSLPASMQSKIRWWIADPTGYPHIVPGSQATQWYWGSNYDESEALPSF
jgi:hypothetical protein